MAFYIRDDRLTPTEAARLNVGRSEGTKVQGHRTSTRIGSDFIHAAETVMHDACLHEHVPATAHGDLTTRMDARDEWADQFGPGHALCWVRLYTVRPDAPACFFCGEEVR